MKTVKSFSIFLCFILITFIFAGCNHSSKNKTSNSGINDHSVVEIDVNYESSSDCLPFDSLFDDVFFVKLETTEKSLIGRISQVLFVDNKITVVDEEIAKNISVFDMSGHFLNNIGNIGGGPEEYSRIKCVALYPDSSMIVVNDNATHLKYYNIDGAFVKGGKLPYENDIIEFLSNKTIVTDRAIGNQIDNNKDYLPRFILSDTSGKVYYSAFETVNNKKFHQVTFFPVRKYGDQVFYNPSFSDTIYQVDINGLTPKYVFKMKGVKPLVIDKNITDQIMDDYHKKYPFFNGEWFDLENSVYVTFMHQIIPWERFTLYSKKQQKSFCSTGELYNPLFYFWHTPKARYKDNYLVSSVSAAELLSRKEDMYNLKQNLPKGKEDILDDLFQDLTEDDNPVLFFYRVNI
ncbi:MAG: 6-bladed beta-propeller [Dysgonamonadaceae bacterium]|jgi:hypothetical protein|nr:6-bladed beta-propeller [Dysgonamonadaceae bacterium]